MKKKYIIYSLAVLSILGINVDMNAYEREGCGHGVCNSGCGAPTSTYGGFNDGDGPYYDHRGPDVENLRRQGFPPNRGARMPENKQFSAFQGELPQAPSTGDQHHHFNPATISMFKGDVVNVTKVEGRDGDKVIRAVIRTNQGDDVEVRLGPSSFFDKKNFTLREGDKVILKGSKTNWDGRTIIIVQEIQRDNEKLILRDNEGRPVWMDRNTDGTESDRKFGFNRDADRRDQGNRGYDRERDLRSSKERDSDRNRPSTDSSQTQRSDRFSDSQSSQYSGEVRKYDSQRDYSGSPYSGSSSGSSSNYSFQRSDGFSGSQSPQYSREVRKYDSQREYSGSPYRGGSLGSQYSGGSNSNYSFQRSDRFSSSQQNPSQRYSSEGLGYAPRRDHNYAGSGSAVMRYKYNDGGSTYDSRTYSNTTYPYSGATYNFQPVEQYYSGGSCPSQGYSSGSYGYDMNNYGYTTTQPYSYQGYSDGQNYYAKSGSRFNREGATYSDSGNAYSFRRPTDSYMGHQNQSYSFSDPYRYEDTYRYENKRYGFTNRDSGSNMKDDNDNDSDSSRRFFN